MGVVSLGWTGRGVVSSYGEEEFHFGYGVKVMDNFVLPLAVFEITFGEIYVGANFKMLSISLEKNQYTDINSALIKFYDSTFAVDVGILFKPSARFSFGAGF